MSVSQSPAPCKRLGARDVAEDVRDHNRILAAADCVYAALRCEASTIGRLVLVHLAFECEPETRCMARFDGPTFAHNIRIDESDMHLVLAELSSLGLIYLSVYGLIVFPETLEEPLCENLLLAADFALRERMWEDRPHPLPSRAALKLRALAAFESRCAYCARQGSSGMDPDGRAWELDRIHPGNSGGGYVTEDVALACRACNQDKRARLDWAGPTPSLADIEALATVCGL